MGCDVSYHDYVPPSARTDFRSETTQFHMSCKVTVRSQRERPELSLSLMSTFSMANMTNVDKLVATSTELTGYSANSTALFNQY